MKSMQMQIELGTTDRIRRDRSINEIIAVQLSESPTGEDRLMESICERENMLKALKRVESNKGKPGVDGMKTTQLRKYIRRHWDKIKTALMEGAHKPFPVRRVEIPKPNGGMRKLGIPSVMDRLMQQAVVQVLTVIYDYTFSDSSFGYRPGKSQAQAVEQFRQYVEDGYTYAKIKNLIKLGLNRKDACKLGNSRRKTWRISGNFNLNFAMPQKLFVQQYRLIVLR